MDPPRKPKDEARSRALARAHGELVLQSGRHHLRPGRDARSAQPLDPRRRPGDVGRPGAARVHAHPRGSAHLDRVRKALLDRPDVSGCSRRRPLTWRRAADGECPAGDHRLAVPRVVRLPARGDLARRRALSPARPPARAGEGQVFRPRQEEPPGRAHPLRPGLRQRTHRRSRLARLRARVPERLQAQALARRARQRAATSPTSSCAASAGAPSRSLVAGACPSSPSDLPRRRSSFCRGYRPWPRASTRAEKCGGDDLGSQPRQPNRLLVRSASSA